MTGLVGVEATYTFQNMNIERGLLWAQEPLVTRGGQLGYTQDPLAFALQWTDGFYSNRYTWLTGSATYTLDPSNSFVLAAGGNLAQTAKVTTTTPFFQTTAVPLFQNNETLFSLAYTYSSAPWTITPYFQFTHVPASSSISACGPASSSACTSSASTISGAILANYTFGDNSLLPGCQPAGAIRVYRLDRQRRRRRAQSAVWSWQQRVVDNLYADLSVQDFLCSCGDFPRRDQQHDPWAGVRPQRHQHDADLAACSRWAFCSDMEDRPGIVHGRLKFGQNLSILAPAWDASLPVCDPLPMTGC